MLSAAHNAAIIAKALGGVQRSVDGWLTRCPVSGHGWLRGDRNPSPEVWVEVAQEAWRELTLAEGARQ